MCRFGVHPCAAAAVLLLRFCVTFIVIIGFILLFVHLVLIFMVIRFSFRPRSVNQNLIDLFQLTFKLKGSQKGVIKWWRVSAGWRGQRPVMRHASVCRSLLHNKQRERGGGALILRSIQTVFLFSLKNNFFSLFSVINKKLQGIKFWGRSVRAVQAARGISRT